MKNKFYMNLVGQDGNAFAILGRFRQMANQNGWTKNEIDKVLKEAMSGDYNHLLATIMANTEYDID
jgi:hypothetical protein